MKIERPRPLAEKKCYDIWTAACDHTPMLKLAGHKGISIALYLQDGLFSKPFGKMMRARHGLFFAPEHCPLQMSATARELAELRDWVFAWTCCAHSCSRALKWGLAPLVDHTDMLEDAHVSISALLRASTGLLQSVPQFVASCVVFDKPPPACVADIEHFWASLDVKKEFLPLFVEVDPSWTGGRLHVSASVLAKSDAIATVTTIIHYCLKWVDFSDTRWTKVGQCGRLYLRSLAIGVDGIVKIAQQSDAICGWHLNGYGRKCTAPVRRYLAVAACAGRPSETLLLDFMRDDWFLKHCDQNWETLTDEHLLILDTPQHFYDTIGELIQVDPLVYKAQVVAASTTSIGYLYMDLWVPLAASPWKYIVGIPELNIEELTEGPAPTDDVGLKMYTLATLGYEKEVASACALIQESAMTTILVEQCHASGAQIMHRHPQLEQESLCYRMTVHNSRTLFHPSAFAKEEDKLRELIDDLGRQMTNQSHTGPRQMYCQLLVRHAKTLRLLGDPSEHAVRRSVFKLHGKQYELLSNQDKAALSGSARLHQRTRVNELQETREQVRAKVDTLRTRRQAAERLGPVNHIDSCRFGPAEFTRFAELWPEYESQDTLGRLKLPPGPVPVAMQTLIQDQIKKMEQPKVEAPEWLGAVVTHRDDFSGCGFYSSVSHPDASVVYRLVLAIAQPRRAIFLECHRCRPTMPDMMSLAPGEMPHRPTYGDYSYTAMRFLDHSEVPFTLKEEIMVFSQMPFQQSHVHTYGWPVLFSVFTRFQRPPVAVPSRQPASHRRSRGPIDEETLRLLQLEFPWMTLEQLQELLSSKATVSVGVGRGGASTSSGSGQPVPLELPQDVIADVATQLQALRNDIAVPVESYFRVRVLGGEWSITLFRKVAKDIGAYPKNKDAVSWCQAVGWPPGGSKTGVRSFSVSMYGLEGSRHLAEEMCRRGDHYLRSWVDAGSPTPYDFAPVKVGYVSTREYIQWFDDIPLSSHASKVAFQIRDFVPDALPA